MITDDPFGQDRLGILGGMGSAATAHFLHTLAQRSSAAADQDHVPFALLSCPEIPDRSSAVETGDARVPAMIRARLRQLEQAGCGAVAIPCNTAHYWRHDFTASLQVPLIDMVSVTAEHAARLGARNAVVLGTRSTIRYRLYDAALKDFGVQPIDISDEVVHSTHSAIALAKSGNLDSSSKHLAYSLAASRALHPDVIILGCTELPMVLPAATKDADLIDSTTCLADACIHWWRSRLELAAESTDLTWLQLSR